MPTAAAVTPEMADEASPPALMSLTKSANVVVPAVAAILNSLIVISCPGVIVGEVTVPVIVA